MKKLKSLSLENFTAFSSASISFSGGLNVFIGENSTGKTHLMKVLYSALTASSPETIVQNLLLNFLPSEDSLGRLVRRSKVSTKAKLELEAVGGTVSVAFSNHTNKTRAKPKIEESNWNTSEGSAVFIPVRESLAQAPGFRSLYTRREVHIEKLQYDLVDKCFLPTSRGVPSGRKKQLIEEIEKAIDGRVVHHGEMFFLLNGATEIEFTLLSEGLRKIALLSILAQNEVLSKGSILFWDEPEANLNPGKMGLIAELLLILVQQGVQIFISTHEYILLKELQLRSKKRSDAPIRFHSFERASKSYGVDITSAASLSDIAHNPILESYLSIADRELHTSMREP